MKGVLLKSTASVKKTGRGRKSKLNGAKPAKRAAPACDAQRCPKADTGGAARAKVKGFGRSARPRTYQRSSSGSVRWVNSVKRLVYSMVRRNR